MKMTATVTWMAAVMLAAAAATNAQEPAGGGDAGRSGGQLRHNPEQVAQRLTEKFDANKDGELSQDELTQALETLRKNRPHRAGSGEQGGQMQAPPPADQVAAKMIEKFSSDKKGLTQAELAKALEARRANREQQGGGP